MVNSYPFCCAECNNSLSTLRVSFISSIFSSSLLSLQKGPIPPVVEFFQNIEVRFRERKIGQHWWWHCWLLFLQRLRNEVKRIRHHSFSILIQNLFLFRFHYLCAVWIRFLRPLLPNFLAFLSRQLPASWSGLWFLWRYVFISSGSFPCCLNFSSANLWGLSDYFSLSVLPIKWHRLQ